MEKGQGRMIGQDFLDLRTRLGAALHLLAEVAPDAGANPDHAVILENLVNSLKDPFVFVVVGEVNVGKSTLLNALFGAEFSRTGIMPTTDKIYFFKHGIAEKRVPITRTLEEVFVPIDFLKDFHVVDTPGTNSVETEHQEITERFVPASDLVIFVFSAINPWGNSTWQFLERVHKHWMRHVIFVLGQCDLRTEEEVAAILDYMRNLCRQRFGREFPIFPVSAKSAFLSRSSGIDRERLFASSGFPKLEEHISKSMGASGQRTGKLANALRIAGDILGGLEANITSRVAGREEKERILNLVVTELADIEERCNAKLSGAIEATGADFDLAARDALDRLKASLSTWAAFENITRDGRSVTGLERALFDAVRKPGLTRWENASTIVEDDVGAAADHLSAQFGAGLKVQVREELRPDMTFWETHRHRLRQHLENVLQHSAHKLGIEREVEGVLSLSRKLALGTVGLLLPFLMGAGFLVMHDMKILGGVLAAVGLGAAASTFMACRRLLSGTRKSVTERLAAAGPELRQRLEGDLRDEVQQIFMDMTRILQPTREKLVEQEKRHHALSQQLKELHRTFSELEEELETLSAQGPK